MVFSRAIKAKSKQLTIFKIIFFVPFGHTIRRSHEPQPIKSSYHVLTGNHYVISTYRQLINLIKLRLAVCTFYNEVTKKRFQFYLLSMSGTAGVRFVHESLLRTVNP